MDKRILIIFVVVIASGCTNIQNPVEEDDQKTDEGMESDPAAGKGLEVTEFSITDDSLTSGQRAVVKLALKNYHTIEVPFTDGAPYIYSLGGLEIVDQGDCGSSIEASSNGLNPIQECTWTIEAPEENDLGNLQSKTYNPRMMIRYNSRLTNVKDPLKVQFKPGIDIESTDEVSKSYSNGEMSMTLTTDSPVPNEGSTNLMIDLNPIGETHVLSEEYTVEISPASIIEGECVDEGSVNDGKLELTAPAEVGSSAAISCRVSSEASRQVERNLIVSTSYKYQQSPALNIEVLSNNG